MLKKLITISITTIVILAVVIGVSIAATVYVNDATGNDSRTYADAQNSATPWKTVQHAINNVFSNDIISVAAGTYTEQLTIDKSLNLIGAGETTTTIQALTSGRSTIVNSGITWDYVVAADGGGSAIDVKIQGFTIDANGQDGSSSQNFVGVFFNDVGDGTNDGLYSCTINNFGSYGAVWSGTYNTWMGNYGIQIYGQSSLTIDDNDIDDYTVSGVGARGSNVNVVVSGNDLDGTDSDYAGIFLRDGVGTISGNNIHDHTGAGESIGIYLYQAATNTKIDDNTTANTLADNYIGVFLAGTSSATIEGNTFTDNEYRSLVIQQDSDNNIVKDNTITMTGKATLDGIYIGSNSGGNIIGASGEANAITMPTSTTEGGGGSHLPRGIYLSGVGASDNTIHYNTLDGSASAIQIDGNTGTTTVDHNSIGQTTAPSFRGVQINGGSLVLTNNTLKNSVRPVEFWGATNVTISGNTIDGTTFDFINIGSFTGTLHPIKNNAFINVGTNKLHNRTSSAVDATENWWGDTDPTDNIQNSGGGSIDYSPWWGANYVGDTHSSAWTWYTDDSIQDAIDVATAGDVINVKAGAYSESVTLNKNDLTVVGDVSSRPSITGGMQFASGLTGLTFKNFVVTGVATVHGSIMRSMGVNTDLTIDNCVFDGENVSGRLGYSGGQLEGDVSITNCEFKRILGWALLDSKSGSGGDGSAMGTITFAGNNVHDSNGSVVFRGLSTDPTDEVNVYDNTWDNIGGNNGETGQHWAAFEVNRSITVNVYDNTVNDVTLGEWSEGQAFQFWSITTLEVYGNTITNNAQGIFIYGDSGGGLGGPFAVPGGSVHCNVISGNAEYGLKVDAAATGGPLKAEKNWWGHATGPSGVAPGSGDVVTANVDFDPWLADNDIGNCDNLIPVELNSFSAKFNNNVVTLNWSTATETENLGFHVFRSEAKDGEFLQINSEMILGAGSSGEAHSYSYTDQDVEAGNTYYYKLTDVDFNGNISFHGPISVTVEAATPTKYALEQNYPNPFNPETAINFSIKEAGKVILKIFNLQGQLIRTLVDEDKLTGSYSVIWNGTNDQGVRLSSGTYLYTLKVNGFEETKKMSFMR